MGSKKHEPSYFRPPRSSICQRNSFRFVCGAGAKTKNVLLERWHKRNWRLCSLCKSIYEWRVFTWCSGELSTKINYRMEPELRYHSPITYVCTECIFPCAVYL